MGILTWMTFLPLIGMAATLLSRTKVGKECLIAAGAVVIPDTVIPDRHLVAGIPAKIIRPLNDEDLQYIRFNGSLIGGLAGLALYTLEYLLRLL